MKTAGLPMKAAALLLVSMLAPAPAGAPPVARGHLRLSIASPPAQSVPREVAVRVRPTLGIKGLEDHPWEVTLTCPVRNGECSCDLPAGPVDLRLQAAASMPVYRWGELVQPGRTTDLGTLKLERGASISGWVRTRGEKVVTHSVLVTLEPLRVGTALPSFDLKLQRTFKLGEDSRPWGFFKFDGVSPGSYAVAASEPGLPTARFGPIEIEGDRSFEIQRPLELASQLRLEVRLSPPSAPDHQPWQIALEPKQQGIMKGSPGNLPRTATPEGLWQARDLGAGDYELRVGLFDHFVKTIPVHLGSESQLLDVPLPLVQVRGRVTKRGSPVAANLSLATGSIDAILRSGDEGWLEGFLPAEPVWSVTVAPPGRTLSPPPFRLQEPVKVLKPGVAGFHQLDVKIPDTRLTVEVVDDRNQSLPKARVVVLGQIRNEAETDGEGRSAFSGLKPGPQRLFAYLENSPDRRSRVAGALLKEGGDMPPVRLVVPEVIGIRGRIRPRLGFAPGTQVYALPLGSEPSEGVSARTDVDGDFLLSLPAGTRGVQLVVLPPGSALRLLDSEVSTRRLLEIGVEPAGGTLILELPPAELEVKASEPPEDEVLTLPRLLRKWADLQGTPQSPGRLVVPNVEPGPYTLCVTTKAPVLRRGAPPAGDLRCAGGVLEAAGELALKLPSLPPVRASN